MCTSTYVLRTLRAMVDGLNSRNLSNLLVVGTPLSDDTRKRLEPYFTKITLVEDRKKDADELQLAEADVIFGFPVNNIKSASQVPRLQFIQLTSAGSELAQAAPLWQDEASKRIQLLSASGVHTSPIPQVRWTVRDHSVLISLMFLWSSTS